MRRPNSMRHLDDAIRRLCGGAPQDFVRARTVMANAIVASILPDGVVKGGSGRAVPAWGKRAVGTGPACCFSLAMQSKHLESPLASFRDLL